MGRRPTDNFTLYSNWRNLFCQHFCVLKCACDACCDVNINVGVACGQSSYLPVYPLCINER